MDTKISNYDFIVLVDFDNARNNKCDIVKTIKKWITKTKLFKNFNKRTTSTLLVRIYGGWYRETCFSEARNEIFINITKTIPALIKISSKYVRVHVDFADKLLLQLHGCEDVLITHTVMISGRVYGYKMKQDHTCDEPDCKILDMKRALSKRKACTSIYCKNMFFESFERNEQKQVDMHLGLDLLLIATSASLVVEIAVFSDDWDLLPALIASSHKKTGTIGITAIRCSDTKTYLDDELGVLDTPIIIAEVIGSHGTL